MIFFILFFQLLPILEPCDVADAAVQGVLTNEDTIFAPWFACYLLALRALLPNEAALHFGDMLGTTSSMDEFRGRKKK